MNKLNNDKNIIPKKLNFEDELIKNDGDKDFAPLSLVNCESKMMMFKSITEQIKCDREQKDPGMQFSTSLLEKMKQTLLYYEGLFQNERKKAEEMLDRVKKEEDEKTSLLKQGISLLNEGIANNKKVIEALLVEEENQIINDLQMQINPSN